MQTVADRQNCASAACVYGHLRLRARPRPHARTWRSCASSFVQRGSWLNCTPNERTFRAGFLFSKVRTEFTNVRSFSQFAPSTAGAVRSVSRFGLGPAGCVRSSSEFAKSARTRRAAAEGASKPTQPQVLTVLQWCFCRIGCSLCWGGMRGVFGAMPSASTRYSCAARSPARA